MSRIRKHVAGALLDMLVPRRTPISGKTLQTLNNMTNSQQLFRRAAVVL
jgi:hypothetical protein